MSILYETPRGTDKEGNYLIDDKEFNNIRKKILEGNVFQLIYIQQKEQKEIPLKRNPRGVDCGILNPEYMTNYKYRNENTLMVKCSHPQQENYILFEFDKKENINPTWIMDINTLNIYYEASHYMQSSTFYVEIFRKDFDILFI